MTTHIMDVRLNLIKIGDRARKDLGAIDLLAASIEHLGLLQPIGIDQNYRLVFGERRFRAFELLGRETIPARIVHVDSLLQAEHAENEIRKDFTPLERNAIARALMEELGDRRRFNADDGPRLDDSISKNICESKGKKTSVIAAKAAGFGNETTMRQSMLVEDKAIPELAQAMDRGEVVRCPFFDDGQGLQKSQGRMDIYLSCRQAKN